MPSNYKKSNVLSCNNVIGIESHTGNDDNNYTDVQDVFSNLWLNHHNRVMIAHLNINRLRIKFEMLSEIVANNLDITFSPRAKYEKWLK